MSHKDRLVAKYSILTTPEICEKLADEETAVEACMALAKRLVKHSLHHDLEGMNQFHSDFFDFDPGKVVESVFTSYLILRKQLVYAKNGMRFLH